MGIKVTADDRRFSLAIRGRDKWTCQYCGTRYPPNSRGLECAHIYGRGDKLLRHEFDNALALCTKCHFELSAHPAVFVEFVQKHLGMERFERLSDIHNRKRNRV
jgi:uncharacterized Zn-finger protein